MYVQLLILIYFHILPKKYSHLHLSQLQKMKKHWGPPLRNGHNNLIKYRQKNREKQTILIDEDTNLDLDEDNLCPLPGASQEWWSCPFYSAIQLGINSIMSSFPTLPVFRFSFWCKLFMNFNVFWIFFQAKLVIFLIDLVWPVICRKVVTKNQYK